MSPTKTTGSAKKKSGGGSSSKKGGLDDILGYGFLILVAVAAVRTFLAEAVPRFTFWWDDSLVPWWHDILPYLIAATVFFGLVPALAYGYWRFRHRARRAVKKRVEDRQPDDIPTKPYPLGIDEDGQAAAIAVPVPKGKPLTDKKAKQLADHHGRGEWGEAGEHELRIDPKTKRDEIVVHRPVPEPVDDRPKIEQDLTKIAQEQLPHVQAVTVAARDKDGNPTVIEVHHEVTAKLLSSPAVAEAIERALAAQLRWDDPNLYRMHWDRDRSVGILEKCDDPLPRVVPFPFGKLTDIIARGTNQLFYGTAGEHGDELQGWDLDLRPHSLVCGETGFGKTATLGTIIAMALLKGWRVVVFDPKKRAFRHLDGLPNFERYGDARGDLAPQQIADGIKALHDLMNGRYDLDDEELDAEQRILVVVDELFELWAGLNRLWKGSVNEDTGRPNTGEHPCIGMLEEISGLAREAMIHLLYAIQRPDAKVGGGYMRSQLGNRLVLGPMEPDGGGMVFGRGSPWVKTATLTPAVKGRCLAPVPGGRIAFRLAQVWWLDLKDRAIRDRVRAAIVEMHPESLVDPLVPCGRRAHRGARPVDEPETNDDPDTGEQPVVGLDKDDDGVEEQPPARPAKKAVAKKATPRRPRKAAASPPASDGPEIISRDPVHADQLAKGDWVRIPVKGGGTRDVRIATDPKLDEDAETVSAGGFGWTHTWPMLETVMLLHVADDDGEHTDD